MVMVTKFQSALPRAGNVVTAGPFSGFFWKAPALLGEAFVTDYGQLVPLKTVEFEVYMYQWQYKIQGMACEGSESWWAEYLVFAGLGKLDADGFEAAVTVRREEARGCSCHCCAGRCRGGARWMGWRESSNQQLGTASVSLLRFVPQQS